MNRLCPLRGAPTDAPLPPSVVDNPSADVPGLGPIPIKNLPSLQRAGDKIAGEVPAALRSYVDESERDALLGRLIFTSRRLASECLVRWKGNPVLCLLCGAVSNQQTLTHAACCAAGDVNKLLEDLCALSAGEAAGKGGAR